MAITAPKLWLDGAIVETSRAHIPLMGHPAQRGSLVFDVGAFHSSYLFRARDHVVRFARSAKIVGLALSFDEHALLAAAITVVRQNGLKEGLIRWSVFYAASEPDLVPRDATTHIAVAAQSLQDAPNRNPIGIATFDNARKASPDALPVEAKAAAAYLGPMIARKRAIALGFDDVVLLDREGAIAEAPIANVFLVKDDVLITPPLGRILPGITRDTVLSIARAEGISVRDTERVERAELEDADEAFLTATSMPLSPIGRVNDQSLRNAPGPITTRLMDRVMAARRGDDPKRRHWLTPITD